MHLVLRAFFSDKYSLTENIKSDIHLKFIWKINTEGGAIYEKIFEKDLKKTLKEAFEKNSQKSIEKTFKEALEKTFDKTLKKAGEEADHEDFKKTVEEAFQETLP